MSKYPQISWLIILAWVSSASAGGLLSFWSSEPKRLVPVPAKATSQTTAADSPKPDDEELPAPRSVDKGKPAPKGHDMESHGDPKSAKTPDVKAEEDNPEADAQPISLDGELHQPRRVGADQELAKPRKVDIKADLAKLRAERETLADERHEAGLVLQNTFTADSEKLAQLRLRAGELLARFSLQEKLEGGERKAPPRRIEVNPPKEKQPKTKPDTKVEDKDKPIASRTPPKELDPDLIEAAAVNGQAAAENYFRAGNYASALAAYRKLELAKMPAETRQMTQYMMATCLRKLGKIDEAAALFKEVTNGKGDDVVVECAQWQLNSISWRDDLQKQIKKLHDKRQPADK